MDTKQRVREALSGGVRRRVLTRRRRAGIDPRKVEAAQAAVARHSALLGRSFVEDYASSDAIEELATSQRVRELARGLRDQGWSEGDARRAAELGVLSESMSPSDQQALSRRIAEKVRQDLAPHVEALRRAQSYDGANAELDQMLQHDARTVLGDAADNEQTKRRLAVAFEDRGHEGVYDEIRNIAGKDRLLELQEQDPDLFDEIVTGPIEDEANRERSIKPAIDWSERVETGKSPVEMSDEELRSVEADLFGPSDDGGDDES